MGNQQAFKAPSDLVIQLEIISEEEHAPDPAALEEISLEMVDALRAHGYTVEPTYTATKGNPTFDIIVHISQFIQDNKEWMAAMFSTASLALQLLLKEHERRTKKEQTQRPPLEIIMYVNDCSVSVDSNNPPTSKAVDKGGRPQDTAKIQIRVPKTKRHRR